MIVLFAALGVAMSQGSRSGESTLSDEKARLAATDIIGYGASLRNAVKQLQIRGCSDTQISFQSDRWPNQTLFNNTLSPSDNSCHLFHPDGGGMNVMDIPAEWYSRNFATTGIRFSGGNSVLDVGPGAMNVVTSMELGFYINGISDEICLAINKMAGITDIPDNGIAYAPSNYFVGAYSASGQIRGGTALSRKMFGCFYTNVLSIDSNIFYQVLIAR